jgi:transcriptional regulator with XRE-family HTH domain
MSTNSESCTATNDQLGVPYNARLKRLRESTGMSLEAVARELDVSVREYEECERYAGELNTALTISELSKIGNVLGVWVGLFFEDKASPQNSVSPAQLSANIKSYLQKNGLEVSEFENRVGFEIRQALFDPNAILEWNVDCLRFVCAEIQVNWFDALP